MAARACKRCEAGACESSVRSEGARGRRWHLRSQQQATTLGTGQFVSGRHHMVVPVESRLKGCQHRAPKVRKSGSRGCRQAKCVSKLQRQQAHICLEVKQPTSWLELPPSLGGAGIAKSKGKEKDTTRGPSTCSQVAVVEVAAATTGAKRQHATSKPSIDPHVALLVAAARTGAKCQQDFSTKHEQVRRRRQRPQSHRCRS